MWLRQHACTLSHSHPCVWHKHLFGLQWGAIFDYLLHIRSVWNGLRPFYPHSKPPFMSFWIGNDYKLPIHCLNDSFKATKSAKDHSELMVPGSEENVNRAAVMLYQQNCGNDIHAWPPTGATLTVFLLQIPKDRMHCNHSFHILQLLGPHFSIIWIWVSCETDPFWSMLRRVIN